jgi:O-antigen ligase
MATAPPRHVRHALGAARPGAPDAAPLWPLLLGVPLAVAAALLIATGQLVFLLPLAAAIPALILFVRYPWAAVLLWVLLVPYVVQEPFDGGRYLFWVFHRFMVPGTLAIVLVSGWLHIGRRPRVRLGRAELALLLFVVAAVVNIYLTARDPSRTLLRAYDRIFVPLMLYMLVRLSQPSEADWRRLAWFGAATLTGQAAIGLIGWFSPHALPENWLGRAGERMVGSVGNPAVFTTTLILFALILFQYALSQRRRSVQAVALTLFSLAFVCVFFSFSRGSWGGSLLVLLGLMVLHPKLMLRWGGGAAIFTTLIAGSLLTTEVSYATQRLGDEQTAQGRVLGASTAVAMIAVKPVFGWGFGNYDVYDEQFKGRAFDLAVREDQTSHNTFLLIASEMGLLGLGLYLAPTLWLLLMSLKVWRRMPKGFLGRQLLAMLWLLLLHHFVVSNFMEMIHSNLFGTSIWWMVHALIASLVAPYLAARDTSIPAWIARYELRREARAR